MTWRKARPSFQQRAGPGTFGAVVGVQQHRNDRDRAALEQALDDETVGMAEARRLGIVHARAGRDVELGLDEAVDQFEREGRRARHHVRVVHEVAAAHGLDPVGALLVAELVARDDLLAVEDGDGRLVGRAEQLALVVAHDEHHVGPGLCERGRQPVQRGMAGALLGGQHRGRDQVGAARAEFGQHLLRSAAAGRRSC
ncbi:MAG: hypothetical protein QM777_17075 [Pseudorhodoferax sp.]